MKLALSNILLTRYTKLLALILMCASSMHAAPQYFAGGLWWGYAQWLTPHNDQWGPKSFERYKQYCDQQPDDDGHCHVYTRADKADDPHDAQFTVVTKLSPQEEYRMITALGQESNGEYVAAVAEFLEFVKPSQTWNKTSYDSLCTSQYNTSKNYTSCNFASPFTAFPFLTTNSQQAKATIRNYVAWLQTLQNDPNNLIWMSNQSFKAFIQLVDDYQALINAVNAQPQDINQVIRLLTAVRNDLDALPNNELAQNAVCYLNYRGHMTPEILSDIARHLGLSGAIQGMTNENVDEHYEAYRRSNCQQ